VKDDPFVEALGDELLDVGDVVRRDGRVHFDDDRALGRLEGQRVACAHEFHDSYFAMRIVTILSGFDTWPLLASVPALILSTTSMPDTTSPNAVYWPSRKPASPKQMKNCELAESGSLERAMPSVPRVKCVLLNSAGRMGRVEPPVPVPVGSPVCAMNP